MMWALTQEGNLASKKQKPKINLLIFAFYNIFNLTIFETNI
jgi:hypothetical protein